MKTYQGIGVLSENNHVEFALFVFNAVDRVLVCCPPTLYDDGGKGDGADGEKCQRKEPPIDGSPFGKSLEPLVADVPSQWGCDDETAQEQPDVAAREHREDFARR